MRTNRLDLLARLQAVKPGLSTRELIEQSSCFVFKDNSVFTFNDEVACRAGIKGIHFTGAVPAEPFLAVLEKLVGEEIDLETTDAELLISDKGRRAGIRLESEIVLPYETHVENPTKWRDLSSDFEDAINIVYRCASKDDGEFMFSCVHLTPSHIEATNRKEVCRYTIAVPIAKPLLIRQRSLAQIVGQGMTQMAETKSWLHFRSSNGVVLSCRHYIDEEYTPLGNFLKAKGERVQLPKTLAEATDRAEIFAKDNALDESEVLVRLQQGTIRIRGTGNSGWYSETRKIAYKGPDFSFVVDPALFGQLVGRHPECYLSKSAIHIKGDKFTYAACVGTPGSKKKKESSDDAD